MAKVSTERILIDKGLDTEFTFNYDVNVSKDGIFSTTIPVEIAKLLTDAGIELSKNRLDRPGYLSAKTFSELKVSVRSLADEYMSRELISEKVVIQYAIQTTCKYTFDEAGNICPNGHYSILGGGGFYSGTTYMDANSNEPYGMQVYCKPFVRRDYLYRSGKTKTEYLRTSSGYPIVADLLGQGEGLRWLDSIVGIGKPSAKLHEIDYTEPVAGFFVQLIKSICAINHRIKDFLDPDSIKMIVENGGKFLQ